MKIAAIIPCYRVADHIVGVVSAALEQLDHVFVVDDACPEASGDLIEATFGNDRVTVLKHTENRGVGGATITGYRSAIKAGYDVLVKIEGDGQLDLDYLPALLQPLLSLEADYTKGNRFYRKRHLKRMPFTRIFGNSMLSVLNKASSGYWNVMDPTNGFTALTRTAAQEIEWSKVATRYFFESDLLFRLNTARAVVQDVPIPSRYGDENSNLRIRWAIPTFFVGHLRNCVKRFFYSYIVRDFSVGTVHAICGAILFLFGVTFGAIAWMQSARSGQDTSVGTVMVSALPIIIGFQLLLAALSFDIANVPTRPLGRILYLPAEPRSADSDPIPLKKRQRP